MTDNNNNNDNNNNDNKKNNKIVLKPRQIKDLSLNNLKLPPIDFSNNRIFRTWKINPILNHNLLSLDSCKEKNILLSKKSKEIIKKKTVKHKSGK